jgi:hypothetical protein
VRKFQHDRRVSDCLPSEAIADHVDSAVGQPARRALFGTGTAVLIRKSKRELQLHRLTNWSAPVPTLVEPVANLREVLSDFSPFPLFLRRKDFRRADLFDEVLTLDVDQMSAFFIVG